MEENLESIEGYVDHIIYRNADNGYTVLVLVCNEEEETCVGVFSDIAEGENIKAKGSYTEHPTYGRQFQVKSFEDIRWFDIRRWGLAVEHVYQNINNKEVYETYVLEAESPNYVLSLPMDLQRRNDKIEQAQRVETIVKN